MSNTLPTPKILLVDDDPDIIELLEYNLTKEGFDTASATDGLQALEVAKKFKPDLILLDVMMPKMDGIETARQLRLLSEFKDTYILFLTARAEEYTEVAAFDVGADDYVVKPIKPRALLSRLKALLRRDSQQSEAEDKLEIGSLFINRVNYTVLNDGKSLVMPKKEFELLSFLAHHPNKVFSRDELLEKVWGSDVYVVERTVDVHIRKLREKIPEYYIKTLKGVGYMFSVDS
ncbi:MULTISPECIES: response regulator transcription factor [Flectobacillus]|jgi:two-component system alkaline phosphatase synthesis response regulator PhoP|uniref:Response regulator transcription factor n=1 Tax=Flectobacillus roseus TaxID=502259 RepID=A0ABT6YB95_9BACT|nr:MULTISPECIES: response regulator transcription factor [Flectobacillus]MDI9860851.1 response regulator transcription factor [Flectobacillus roseus]MDI9870707.1 response regulator transcription factor [Flectobacillus roseus]NBA76290.1 response regulator [Emticicia sp. ODNR4P]PAC32836.1 DNA-binding response regulator [Flectobacillus sp. BAB-3569]